MSWFEEWFDSPLYETIYSNRNEAEAAQLAELIEDVIPLKQFPKVLDLGCGRGRHSLTLASKGYNVTGIDLSPEAISKAKRLAAERNLTNVEFRVGDMRESSDDKFDAIVNLFTTFGYFLDDRENSRVIGSMSRMLRPEGRLMIDYLNPEYVRNNLVPKEEGMYAPYRYEIERTIRDEMVFKTIRFEGGDLEEPLEYNERVKLYDADWFYEKMERTSLIPGTLYGDYEGGAFDPATSSRMIMLARKEKN